MMGSTKTILLLVSSFALLSCRSKMAVANAAVADHRVLSDVTLSSPSRRKLFCWPWQNCGDEDKDDEEDEDDPTTAPPPTSTQGPTTTDATPTSSTESPTAATTTTMTTTTEDALDTSTSTEMPPTTTTTTKSSSEMPSSTTSSTTTPTSSSSTTTTTPDGGNDNDDTSSPMPTQEFETSALTMTLHGLTEPMGKTAAQAWQKATEKYIGNAIRKTLGDKRVDRIQVKVNLLSQNPPLQQRRNRGRRLQLSSLSTTTAFHLRRRRDLQQQQQQDIVFNTSISLESNWELNQDMMDAYVARAFQAENVSSYLTELRSANDGDAFASVTGVSVLSSSDSGSGQQQEEDDNMFTNPGILVGIVAGALLILFLAAVLVSRMRASRRAKAHEHSDNAHDSKEAQRTVDNKSKPLSYSDAEKGKTRTASGCSDDLSFFDDDIYTVGSLRQILTTPTTTCSDDDDDSISVPDYDDNQERGFHEIDTDENDKSVMDGSAIGNSWAVGSETSSALTRDYYQQHHPQQQQYYAHPQPRSFNNGRASAVVDTMAADRAAHDPPPANNHVAPSGGAKMAASGESATAWSNDYDYNGNNESVDNEDCYSYDDGGTYWTNDDNTVCTQYNVIAPVGMLGIVLTTLDNAGIIPEIQQVSYDSPLRAQGVQVGDQLVAIDDKCITVSTAETVAHLLTSKKNKSPCQLTFIRSN